MFWQPSRGHGWSSWDTIPDPHDETTWHPSWNLRKLFPLKDAKWPSSLLESKKGQDAGRRIWSAHFPCILTHHEVFTNTLECVDHCVGPSIRTQWFTTYPRKWAPQTLQNSTRIRIPTYPTTVFKWVETCFSLKQELWSFLILLQVLQTELQYQSSSKCWRIKTNPKWSANPGEHNHGQFRLKCVYDFEWINYFVKSLEW